MPLVSILVASKNQSRYLEDMLGGLKAQTFQDFEIIVIDSNSQDDSPKLFKEYGKVKFIQFECDANQAYLKALDYSSGKYIMIATTSDFIINYRWIERAVTKLETDRELSCVWGSGVIVDEFGVISALWAEHYLISPPPSKKDYLHFWLYEPYLPELNYVVNAEVFKFCMSLKDSVKFSFNVNNNFLYNFTRSGFLQSYIPEIVNAGRVHDKSLTKKYKRLSKNHSLIFLKLRLIFIMRIYLYRDKFDFKDSNFRKLDKYHLDNFLIFFYKFIKGLIKNSLRKLLKKLLVIIYSK
jgi:glycosyltransferase involved in cell wall biosynthesis